MYMDVLRNIMKRISKTVTALLSKSDCCFNSNKVSEYPQELENVDGE